MLRAIFNPEFKRSLIQKLVVVVATLVGSLLLEQVLSAGIKDTVRGVFGGTPDMVLDALLWILIILSGFVAGAGAFSRINERHIPFVQSLPISRLDIWLTIAGAHFLTALLMAPVVVILRPSLWQQLNGGVLASTSAFGIGAYLVLFGAGCCFVMLFRSLVVMTVAGGLIVAASLGIASLFASTVDFGWAAYFGWRESGRIYGIPMSGNGPNPAFFVMGCLVLAVLYLGLSLRFFVKGEFNLLRTRIRNWVAVVAVMASFPLILSASIEAGVTLSARGSAMRAVASSGGEYIAVIQSRQGNRSLSEVTFVDARSGAKTGTYEFYGLMAAEWSKSGPVLNLWVMQSPLWRLGYLLPASDSILRISPDGQELSRVGFGFAEIHQIHADTKGRLLVTAQSHGQAKLFAVGDDGLSTELVSTAMKDEVSLDFNYSPNLFLVASTRNGLERGWSIEASATEIPYSSRDTSRAEGRFLFDDGWYSPTAASRELARRFPLEAEIQASGGKDALVSYLVPFGGINRIPNEFAFARILNKVTGQGQWLAFSKQRGTWRPLEKPFTLSTPPRTAVGWQPIYYSNRRAMSSDVAVAIVEDETDGGNVDYALYDARLDARIDLPDEGGRAATWRYCYFPPDRPSGVDGFYISCSNSAFVYRPGQDIQRIPRSGVGLLYVGVDGTWIHWNPDTVTRNTPDGKVVRLWPVR
jgi:hypothetical protein